MPLRETEAIVLRTYRLGEADKIVSVFTRQWGRLRAVATGARRTKSRYGSTLEPLSYVKLWLFERENRDLLRMNSAELIESFFDMQKDYRVQVAAQFVAEVAEKLLPEREVNERVFRLILAVLRSLKSSQELDRPLVYFDYWMLRLGGFLPNLKVCGGCGRTFVDETVYYNASDPSLFGSECRAQIASGALRQAISTTSLAEAQDAAAAPLAKWMATPPAAKNLREAREFLESMIEAHTERQLITRSLLREES